jgi:lipopolysaccharide export system protein LptC
MDNPIKIEGTKLSIMGQGLRADLNLGKVTLTQHVKTIFKGND